MAATAFLRKFGKKVKLSQRFSQKRPKMQSKRVESLHYDRKINLTPKISRNTSRPSLDASAYGPKEKPCHQFENFISKKISKKFWNRKFDFNVALRAKFYRPTFRAWDRIFRISWIGCKKKFGPGKILVKDWSSAWCVTWIQSASPFLNFYKI